jgi:ABC-2 type transport system permease protein
LGWITLTGAFDTNNWGMAALSAGTAVALTGLAFALSTRRDVGFGLIPDRAGRPQAGRALLSPIGLAWRLQRGAFVAWLAGLLVMAFPMGAVTDELDQMVSANPTAAEMIQQLGGVEGLVDAFLSAMIVLFGLAIAGYALQALLRMRSEETTGVLEPMLATAVSRSRWLAGHVLLASLGVLVLLVASGAAMGAGYAAATGGGWGTHIGRMAGAGLAVFPAVLVLIGFVVAAFGMFPRWAVGLSWGGLIVCLLLGQIGELLKLPQALLNLSPFTHIPAVPAVSMTVTPVVALLGVAAVLLALGGLAFRRRDLELS